MKKETKTTEKVEKKAKKTNASSKYDEIVETNSETLNKEKVETVPTEPVTDTGATESAEPAVQKPKSLIIKLDDLVPFKNHPYKVLDNADMDELVRSIGESGLFNPLLVRPLEGEDGKYEIISGHRRYHAVKKLGWKKVQCTVHYIDRDAATLMMVDSNSQRTEILPSEKAFAYKMKMDALKRQGKRTDLEDKAADGETSSPVATKSDAAKSVGKADKISRDQVFRYIRLTYLVPELIDFVDKGKIKMRPAVEMSYLPEEVQRDIVDVIDGMGGEVFPSHAQTRRIREQAEKEGISHEQIEAMLSELKPNQVETVKVPTEELRKRIKRNLTDEELIKYLYKTVDFYERHLERQQEAR